MFRKEEAKYEQVTKMESPNSVIFRFQTKPKRAIQTGENQQFSPLRRDAIFKKHSESSAKIGLRTQQSGELLDNKKFSYITQGKSHAKLDTRKIYQKERRQ